MTLVDFPHVLMHFQPVSLFAPGYLSFFVHVSLNNTLHNELFVDTGIQHWMRERCVLPLFNLSKASFPLTTLFSQTRVKLVPYFHFLTADLSSSHIT